MIPIPGIYISVVKVGKLDVETVAIPCAAHDVDANWDAELSPVEIEISLADSTSKNSSPYYLGRHSYSQDNFPLCSFILEGLTGFRPCTGLILSPGLRTL